MECTWVGASEPRIGEKVKTQDGLTVLKSRTKSDKRQKVTATIRLFVQNGKVISGNIFKDTSGRKVQNLIKVKMERNELLKTANSIISQPHSTSIKIEEAEKLLLHYLRDNENDTTMWYHLAILELIPPLVDFESAINYLRRIWKDTKDTKAIIYIAVIQDIHCVISNDIFDILQNIQTDDKQVLSMCYYCLGLYYIQIEDLKNASNSFFKSIELYPYFVHSYHQLGRIYEKENIKLSKYYYTKAVENVKLISDEDISKEINEYCDWLSIEWFENETILGLYATEQKYNYLAKSLSK